MIAFLVAVADADRYESIAAPALERVREVDSPVIAIDAPGPPQPVLNAALDELAEAPDLEGVVIVHEDVQLLDPNTATIVRDTFRREPDVAIAGVIGASGVASLAWWQANGIGRARTPHHPDGEVAGYPGPSDVDAVDGIVLCLSPWAVRTLRFDEELAADFHGYDIDLCFQARHHGRRVTVIELDALHEHRPLFDDAEAWVRNELRFRQRWIDHRMITQRRRASLAPSGEPDPPG